MKNQHFRYVVASVLFALVFWVIACQKENTDSSQVAPTNSSVEDRNANSKVFPPTAHPHGQSYAEWSVNWMQQFLTYDCANNPFSNSANALFYQSGPVYFLAGLNTPGASVNITVPHGKAILFPLVNYINDYPCPSEFNFEPVPPQTLAEFLTQGAVDAMSGVSNLSVTIDGNSVSNPANYLFTSELFYFTGNSDLSNCFDPCITGSSQPAVTSGFYMMLKPLSKGTHTVHYHAEIQAFNFIQDGTYNITIP